MKTDYAGHEEVYRRRRAQGFHGWDEKPEDYARQQALLAGVLAKSPAPSSGKLLELGCGAGNISVWLARRGFDVTGVDISETAIEWARHRADEEGLDIRFIRSDVLDLKDVLRDGGFDLVLDSHCLHCIIGGDRKRFLAEAGRVLKPDALLLLDSMCGPVEPGSIDGFDPASGCSIFNGVATRYWGEPDSILREVRDSGFTVVDVSTRREHGHGFIIILARKCPGSRNQTAG